MTEANHTFMHELNEGHGATVDARLVPIVKFLNRLSVKTVRSHLDSEFASIEFTGTDYKSMSELLFNHIGSMTGHLDYVELVLGYDNMMGYVGSIEIRAEALDDVSARVGVWLEMLHK